MLADITLGQYYPGTSLIHMLDPRTKILAIFIFICGIFLAQSGISYLILSVFLLLAICIAKIPFSLVIRSIKPLWMIITLTLLIHFFSTPGTIALSFGMFTITFEGLRQGTMMAGRLILLIITSSLLTFTTSPIRLTDGMEYLLNPFSRWGLPAHELALMMTIALRFIPTLLEETDKIMKAQMSRGADFSSGNLFSRAKNMIPLLVPLFISAFRRADELAIAMEARCYQGGASRTRMRELKMRTADIAALCIVTILVAVLTLIWVGML